MDVKFLIKYPQKIQDHIRNSIYHEQLDCDPSYMTLPHQLAIKIMLLPIIQSDGNNSCYMTLLQ